MVDTLVVGGRSGGNGRRSVNAQAGEGVWHLGEQCVDQEDQVILEKLISKFRTHHLTRDLRKEAALSLMRAEIEGIRNEELRAKFREEVDRIAQEVAPDRAKKLFDSMWFRYKTSIAYQTAIEIFKEANIPESDPEYVAFVTYAQSKGCDTSSSGKTLGTNRLSLVNCNESDASSAAMLVGRPAYQPSLNNKDPSQISSPSVAAPGLSSSILMPKLSQLDPTHLSVALSRLTKNLVKAIPWGQKDNQVVMLFSMLQQCTSLAMMSDGVTRKELASTFGLDGDDLSMKLLKLASNTSKTLEAIQKNMEFGTSIWINAGGSDYTPEAMRRFNDLKIRGIPMELKSGDMGKGHELVNAWVKSKTAGDITKLLSEDDVSSMKTFIVANFSLLNAKWKYPFTRFPTPLAFSTPGGIKEVQMMTLLNADIKYHSGHGFECFSLPYEAGAGLSLAVFLPNIEHSLSATYAKLINDSSDGQSLMVKSLHDMENSDLQVSNHVLGTGFGKRTQQKISVTMPIWEEDTSLDTKQVLESMGVKAAFDPHAANFNGIIEGGAVIDVMKDKTKIRIDETGTTVISAGAAVGAPRSGANLKVIMVDRPFAYTIYAEETVPSKEGPIKMPMPLAIGVVNDPTGNAALST